MPTPHRGFFVALWRSAPLALLGIGCYFLSWFLDNLYWYAGDLEWLAQGADEMFSHRSYRYLDGVDLPEDVRQSLAFHTVQLRLYQFSSTFMRAVLACVIAWQCKTVLARLVWVIYAVAELFSVVEYTLCKMVADHHTMLVMSRIVALEGETSACGRLYGPVGHWIVPTITTLALLWILTRAYQVWRNTNRKHGAG